VLNVNSYDFGKWLLELAGVTTKYAEQLADWCTEHMTLPDSNSERSSEFIKSLLQKIAVVLAEANERGIGAYVSTIGDEGILCIADNVAVARKLEAFLQQKGMTADQIGDNAVGDQWAVGTNKVLVKWPSAKIERKV
jgi:hypothetical protein